MKKQITYIFLLCFSFALFYFIKELWFAPLFYAINGVVNFYPFSFFTAYLFVGLPLLGFVLLTNKYKLLKPLGLWQNPIKGIAIALLFSIPMFVGYGFLSNFNITIDAKTFWLGCVFAAFFEELFYRGFFFGQLFRKTQLGFFPSILLSALIFASLHLYQSNDPATMLGIFITTFLGAGLFAWLYVEWDYNLWLPVGLHFFMNLSWELFSVADNALGGWSANLIRGLTIILAVGGTLLYKKFLKIPLSVNRETLLIKKQPEQNQPALKNPDS